MGDGFFPGFFVFRNAPNYVLVATIHDEQNGDNASQAEEIFREVHDEVGHHVQVDLPGFDGAAEEIIRSAS